MEWKPVTPRAEPDRQAVIEAQTLLSALTEFSQRAGHDLMGPLSQAASLLALYARRHKDQAGDDGSELLEYLLTASARMEGLVGGIRKYMDAARQRPGIDTVDLNHTVAAAKAAIAASISASGAAIAAEALPAVKGDAAQMQTVFEAVIGNAIKFHKPDTAPLVRISGRREGAIAVIAVEDNGIGIEPENREAVFLPFKRLNGREYPGQGLGLALAKLIVAMHGGAIRVMESATGARIEFSVPAP
jgi:light-regulated signal transduction histidine kinase (bacteriophytochrome)